MDSDPQQKLYDELEAHQSRGHTGLGFHADESAPAPAAPAPSAASDIADAIAKAKAIAEKLAKASGAPGMDTSSSAAPAPKRRWNDDMQGPTKTMKIAVPVKERPEVNFVGMILGPRGSTLKHMEDESGAKILLRGKGGSREGDPDEFEDLHVLIEAATDEQLNDAADLVRDILYNPDAAARIKDEQMKQLASERSIVPAGYGATSTALTIGAMLSRGGPAPPASGVEVVMVPNAMVGLIIGKGGETIREIQMRSGANVQIQKETDMRPGQTEREVTVAGSPAVIDEARRAINNIIQDRMRDMAGGSRGGMGGGMGGMGSMGGYGPAPGMGGGGSYGNMLGGGGGGGAHRGGPEAVDLTIPNGSVGLVIGRGGATIKGIQDRTGVHVQIPKVADAHDPASRTITISGQVMHAVEEAKRMVLDVVRQDAANKSGGGGGMQMPVPSNAVIVQVPDDRVGGIIGKGGSVINEIQTRTGTHVQIPPQPEPGTSMRSVSITGNPQGCEQAKQEILAILARGPAGASSSSYGGGSSSYGGGGSSYGAPAPMGGGYGGYGGGAPMGTYGAAVSGGTYGAAVSGGGSYGGALGGVNPAYYDPAAYAAYYQQAAMYGGGGGAPGASGSSSHAAATTTASNVVDPTDPAAVAKAWADYYAAMGYPSGGPGESAPGAK